MGLRGTWQRVFTLPVPQSMCKNSAYSMSGVSSWGRLLSRYRSLAGQLLPTRGAGGKLLLFSSQNAQPGGSKTTESVIRAHRDSLELCVFNYERCIAATQQTVQLTGCAFTPGLLSRKVIWYYKSEDRSSSPDIDRSHAYGKITPQ